MTLNNDNIKTVVNAWIANPNQAQFTDQNNSPYYGHISNWDTSQVTNMTFLFKDKGTFNDDISSWNVSNVTVFNNMFNGATSFNQDISSWNVSSVTMFNNMFRTATSFNQDISSWDVSGCTSFTSMFHGATSFNQDISSWNVTGASHNSAFWNMFVDATSFNQNIRVWNITDLLKTHSMFHGATAFLNTYNGGSPFGNYVPNAFWNFDPSSISHLDNTKLIAEPYLPNSISNVVNAWIADPTQAQFTDSSNTPYFGLISNWNTSQVTNMSSLFTNKTTFNDDISSWNVSNVTVFPNMFNGATSFNQDISSWDITGGAGTNAFHRMFENATSFNQNIRVWNITDHSKTYRMFDDATAFLDTYNSGSNFEHDGYYVPTTFFNQLPDALATLPSLVSGTYTLNTFPHIGSTNSLLKLFFQTHRDTISTNKVVLAAGQSLPNTTRYFPNKPLHLIDTTTKKTFTSADIPSGEPFFMAPEIGDTITLYTRLENTTVKITETSKGIFTIIQNDGGVDGQAQSANTNDIVDIEGLIVTLGSLNGYVITDNEGPLITLNGAATVTIDVGSSYTELSANVVDNVDGNSTIGPSSGSVDINTVGTYTLTYTDTDTAGNEGNSVTRTVHVVPVGHAPVCFLAGTPIQTNQGKIPIEKLNPKIHTIRGKTIQAITKTITPDDSLICFEPNSLGNNLPSQKTVISMNHKILYQGKMTKAKYFTGNAGIYKIPYNQETLYNVLLDSHDKMIVNNMICETLDPRNTIAQLYMSLKKIPEEKHASVFSQYNDFCKVHNIYGTDSSRPKSKGAAFRPKL